MHWAELDVGKKGHGLVLEVYRALADFQLDERYGLTFQLRKNNYEDVSKMLNGLLASFQRKANT